jgi:hypothetical protein
VFKKSYLPLWTEELFVVSEIQYTNPITYKLKDLNGEAITGTFYEQEMQKSKQDTFRIEKVLKQKVTRYLSSGWAIRMILIAGLTRRMQYRFKWRRCIQVLPAARPRVLK